MEARKEDLPKPDYTIEEHDYSLLKENFDRFKVNFHHEFKSLIGQKNSEDKQRGDGRLPRRLFKEVQIQGASASQELGLDDSPSLWLLE